VEADAKLAGDAEERPAARARGPERGERGRPRAWQRHVRGVRGERGGERDFEGGGERLRSSDPDF
jgi:hypothetical protein